MKAFTVEGVHWSKDVEVDDNVFDKKEIGFEAMTRGIECFFSGDYEEEFTGDPSLGLFMVAYEKGKGHIDDEKNMALTEYVLFNAGYDSMAKQFRQYAEEELKKDIEEE
jgi:hypothetical protein